MDQWRDVLARIERLEQRGDGGAGADEQGLTEIRRRLSRIERALVELGADVTGDESTGS